MNLRVACPAFSPDRNNGHGGGVVAPGTLDRKVPAPGA